MKCARLRFALGESDPWECNPTAWQDDDKSMDYRIITSERVPLTFQVAGVGVRFWAWILDFGVIIILLLACFMLAYVSDAMRGGFGVALFAVVSFVVQWGYFLFFEWLWWGQTPGKRLLSIRIINAEGVGPSFSESAVRNILRVLDGLPFLVVDLLPLLYGVGFAAASQSRISRRLGDVAAGTLVVYSEVDDKLARSPLPAAAFGSAKGDVVQRLHALTREQKETILDLCLRRDELRFRDRAQLFTAAADFFKDRLHLQPGEYQSDEQYVLELAKALHPEIS